MEKTFFSVIILAWQVEKYIFECLSSVQNQTFSDFEVIIVAPRGNDKTEEICKAFAETDGRFRIIEAENRGQFINRISGFSEAKGEYLLCLDGDDLWKPELLQTLYDGILMSPCDMIIFGHERFREDQILKKVLGVFPDKKVFSGETKKEVYEKYIQSGPINEIWGKAFKRELFLNTVVDANKYAQIRKSEDLLYCCYLTDQAKKVLYIDQPLYRYRRNPNGVTLTFREDEIKDYYFVKSEIRGFMTKWQMEEEKYLKLFYQALARYTKGWIFHCATSTLPDAKKKELYQWLRKDAPFYKNIISYIDDVQSSVKQKMFWKLFKRSDFLLNVYGKMYSKLKKAMYFVSIKE